MERTRECAGLVAAHHAVASVRDQGCRAASFRSRTPGPRCLAADATIRPQLGTIRPVSAMIWPMFNGLGARRRRRGGAGDRQAGQRRQARSLYVVPGRTRARLGRPLETPDLKFAHARAPSMHVSNCADEASIAMSPSGERLRSIVRLGILLAVSASLAPWLRRPANRRRRPFLRSSTIGACASSRRAARRRRRFKQKQDGEAAQG